MPRITIGDFADVVSKAGSPKATKVAQIKNRDDYNPATDFYKPLRDGIVELHRKSGQKKDLKALLANIPDAKKQVNYPAAIMGYQKWWGKKELKWFAPSGSSYIKHDIEVLVNPELGLLVDGRPHLIKLHLKGEKLIKSRADIITALMELTLRDKAPKDAVICILDVRNAKTYSFSGSLQPVNAMIDGELAYIHSIWEHL